MQVQWGPHLCRLQIWKKNTCPLEDRQDRIYCKTFGRVTDGFVKIHISKKSKNPKKWGQKYKKMFDIEKMPKNANNA